ncbi:hypothetical protein M3Y97_00595300 [Aphelenchoides bicaudatus]|nr:hypothetical protein M3Y97_00595300 [Aphelenchoides bicaudatus]
MTSKRVRVNSDGDAECLNCAELLEQLNTLQIAFDEQAIELTEVRAENLDLKRQLESEPEDRDPNKIQSLEQFGVCPLALAVKPTLKIVNSKQKDTQQAFVPTSAEVKNMKIQVIEVGDVTFEDQVYEKLTVNVKRYPHKNEKRGLANMFICPFESTCIYSNGAPSEMKTHLKRHFKVRVFQCWFCKTGTVLVLEFIKHLSTCMPSLSDDEKQTIAAKSKAKELSLSDVRVVAKQVWLTRLDEDVLIEQLSEAKLALIREHFPSLLDYPNFNDEFMQVLNDVQQQEDPDEPNRARAYLIFELNDQLPDVDEAPEFAIYAGSEVNAEVNKNLRSRRMKNAFLPVSFVHLKLSTNMSRTQNLKDRKFVYVPVVKNIIEDYKENGVWIRSRFAIEDALKRFIESLSDKTFNLYAISRNEYCETYRLAC